MSTIAAEAEPEEQECRFCGYQSMEPERFSRYEIRDHEWRSGPGRDTLFSPDAEHYDLCKFCEQSRLWTSYVYGQYSVATSAVRDINAALNIHLDMVNEMLEQR